ncbi:hypothetical protein AMJ44_12475 [candidate division WOR-1 bacterium DG_54_3]|uniref:Uncharacterized protein n=1 Tax=candidate division WOR-1 bacterium DG_54_3 TaxID=1703775 RepID=A0A0S7XQ56_UNCSA|nr:MAG: hypothetical protein AMJ44_12475 [candidate division WOR-1 bacterium DG_54_3]
MTSSIVFPIDIFVSTLPPQQGKSDDIEEVLGKLTKNSPILLFGYTHREKPAHPSAIAVFTKEILPVMKKRGYRDLVIEVFPAGEPDDPIEQELKQFNATGKIGEEMLKFINVLDGSNFVLLLWTAHKLGIQIHSGGVDYATREETVLHSDFVLGNSEAFKKANEQIVKNAQTKILGLHKQKRKVFALNGCLHNDLDPLPEKAFQSFGAPLVKDTPNVLEIDLVIPELSLRKSYYKDLALTKIQKKNWRNFVPKQGVKLVPGKSKKSYLIFWPWGKRD